MSMKSFDRKCYDLYDRKCYDLAEHFLSDEPAMDCEVARADLASHIQTMIEDWIAYQRELHERHA